MPVPAMLDLLARLRRVDATQRLAAFNEQVTAAHGDEMSVRSVQSTLGAAAGTPRPHGGLAELRQLLGGA